MQIPNCYKVITFNSEIVLVARGAEENKYNSERRTYITANGTITSVRNTSMGFLIITYV